MGSVDDALDLAKQLVIKSPPWGREVVIKWGDRVYYDTTHYVSRLGIPALAADSSTEGRYIAQVTVRKCYYCGLIWTDHAEGKCTIAPTKFQYPMHALRQEDA
jgi:hypothetical protein